MAQPETAGTWTFCFSSVVPPPLSLFLSLCVTPGQILAFSNSAHSFNGYLSSELCVPGPGLAAGDTKTDFASAAVDSGAGCSLHKNIQLGLRKGNLCIIHTESPIQVSGGPDLTLMPPPPPVSPSVSVSHSISSLCICPHLSLFLCVS